MMNIVSKDFKKFCDYIFLTTDGLTKDIALLELEKRYVAYYAKDNEVISK